MASNGLDMLTGDAPEAQEFTFQNFGKLSMYLQTLAWVKDEESGKNKAQRARVPDGQNPAPGSAVEIVFEVDVQELNPTLEFQYSRAVPWKSSANKGKPNVILTDWSEIVLPSLVKVFGKEWVAKVKKQPYICVEDVANVNGSAGKTSGKVWRVPRFVKMYKSVKECVADRDERFQSAGPVASNGEGIPDDIVEKTVGLLKSIGQEQTERYLKEKPFGNYAPEDLISAAVAIS